MALLPFLSLGATLLGGIASKNAADRAAAAAQKAGNFNAKIIERDIDLLEKQRQIVNANFLTQSVRARTAFERDVQGGARAGFGYSGFDIAIGTPLEVLYDNARELQYEQDVAEFNNKVANMQVSDQQESSRLSAELSRMEGGANAASLRSQGATSLINSLSNAASTAYEYKILG